MSFNTKDFEEFKKCDGANPSLSVTQAIIAQVRRDLNPSPWQILAKLGMIHFFVALITLSICPQFGIKLLGDGMGLMGSFMKLGEYGCPIACGTFFMGTSVVVATFLLRPEDIKTIRQYQILEFGALSLLSLGMFVMFHAEIVIGFAIAWFVGTLLGGSIMFELSRLLRLKVQSHSI